MVSTGYLSAEFQVDEIELNSLERKYSQILLFINYLVDNKSNTSLHLYLFYYFLD